MTQYQELANAIVIQAVKDYRCALRYLAKHPTARGTDKDTASRVKKARRIMHETERFFRSDWFRVLSTVNGIELALKIKEVI